MTSVMLSGLGLCYFMFHPNPNPVQWNEDEKLDHVDLVISVEDLWEHLSFCRSATSAFFAVGRSMSWACSLFFKSVWWKYEVWKSCLMTELILDYKTFTFSVKVLNTHVSHVSLTRWTISISHVLHIYTWIKHLKWCMMKNAMMGVVT